MSELVPECPTCPMEELRPGYFKCTKCGYVKDYKVCKDCGSTGLIHCSDPLNCGGPWTTPVEAPTEGTGNPPTDLSTDAAARSENSESDWWDRPGGAKERISLKHRWELSPSRKTGIGLALEICEEERAKGSKSQ